MLSRKYFVCQVAELNCVLSLQLKKVILYLPSLTVRSVTTIRRTGIPTIVPATTDIPTLGTTDTPTLGTTGTPTLPPRRTTDTRTGLSLRTGIPTGAVELVPPTSRFLR